MGVENLAVAFGALPIVTKVGIKTLIAAPFAFHSINGIRHLVWDSGMGRTCSLTIADIALTNKQVIRTGWTVVGLSALTTIGLVAM